MASFGGKVELQGESEYRKALKEITSNLKLVSSELKLTNTEFSNGDRSVKQAKTSYDSMNKTMQDQRAKVDELRETIKKMEQQYGSNNEKVKTFKTQLNEAETKLKDMENATDKSTKELKEMKEGFDDAGQGAVSFGDILKANVLGDVITGGIKALGSAVKTIGSAFLSIGKQALESYADYEQLIGGVQTLFGTGGQSAEEYAKKMGISVEEAEKKLDELIDVEQEVLHNANNAYKTAGLSANEYMETVTGFSASLIQSLNGNTQIAVGYADMAITDMSDNANKMGTSMEMIQNAYQGFAKGNYTMLDNLKLGYGGTKTEMERLLADATKLSGIEYDISSFSDIVEAIHYVQEEMGITGTTAKEASATISGSISSMKSAWQNLITGIADDTVDFEGLIGNFVDSVITVGDNILPRVGVIIEGIVELVMKLPLMLMEHMPQLLETGTNILQKILDGITTMIPALMPVVINIIMTLVNFLTQNLPMILQAGITILVELVKGIAQSLPELIPAIVDAVLLMVETLIDNIDLIIDAGIALILGLADGLIQAIPRLIEKAPVIIQKLVDAIIRNFPKIVQAGGQLIGKLITGIADNLGSLLTSAGKIIQTLVNGISNFWSEVKNTGKYLVQGIWDGISGSLTWIKDKITGWVGSVTKFIKKLFGINSPSRLFRDEIGTNLALGIGEGFEDTMSDVSTEMADAIPTEFDTNTILNVGSNANSSVSSYDNMVNAFETALSKMKVVMNDREFATFVTDTMTKVVYS